MNGARIREITSLAESLLTENAVKAPPVPVQRIAKSRDVQLRYSPLDDELSGMIYVKGALLSSASMPYTIPIASGSPSHTK